MEKKFLALQNKNSDADFQNNEKYVQFKQQLRELKKQCKSACFALLGFLKLGNWIDGQSQKADFMKFAYLLGLILFLNGFLLLLQFYVLSNFWFKAVCLFLKANSFHKVLRKFPASYRNLHCVVPLLGRGIGGKIILKIILLK